MANIKKYKKKDGSTAYKFNVYLGIDPLTGKARRTTRRGFKSPKEAKLALAKIQLDAESNDLLKENFDRFKDIYEVWFTDYSTGIKRSSAQRIEYYFTSQILPNFGELRLAKVTTPYCQKVVNQWVKEFKTYRKLYMYTSKIFWIAKEQNLIPYNPMEKVVLPRQRKVSKRKEDQNFLDKDELKEFLEIVKKNETLQTYLMFHTLAYTGIRKGELLALCWSDVDFEKETLQINKTVSFLKYETVINTTKTTSSDRTITLDQITLSLFRRWRFEQKKELLSRGIRIKRHDKQLIFSNWENTFLGEDFLRSILRKKLYSDFKITPHGFRHTHASLLFESGATAKEVQERLGHSDIKTTLNIYTHVTKETEKNTAKTFLKYMNS